MMKKDNIKNIKDYLVYAFQIINGKTKKDTRMWSYIYEEYNHYLENTNIEGIAFAINYLKQFNYDGKREEKFSIIDSKISLKKPHGGEYLFIHMQHEVYDQSTDSQNPTQYKLPKLKKMTAQMSTYYTLQGRSFDNLQFSPDTTTVDTSSINPYNTVLYMDDLKPRISNDEIWSSDLNFSVQGEYDVDDSKWNFNYFNLSNIFFV